MRKICLPAPPTQRDFRVVVSNAVMKRVFRVTSLLVPWIAFVAIQKSHQTTEKATAKLQAEIQFREVGSRAGIHAVTICGRPEKSAVIEANGSGVCWFDYNNDGLLDVYVVNGSTLEKLKAAASASLSNYHNYIYKNNGDGTFTDVTQTTGLASFRWGTGCAAADYDNDGFVDLFVANVGECFLYKNNGDGTFTDVAKKAGVAGGFNWHTGVTFGDFDSDGFLDLYVASYLEPSQMLEPQKECVWRGMKVYCGPAGFKGAPEALAMGHFPT